MVICIHGMPTPASCIDCMDDGNLPVQRVAPETHDYSFVAQYPGQCPVCDLPITAGQMLARTTRERIVHGQCI